MGTVTILMVIDVGGCFVNVKFGLVVVAAEDMCTPPVVLLAVKKEAGPLVLCLCLCVCELSQVKILLESRREIFCQMPDACRGDEACVSAVCVGDGACVNAVAVCFLQRMACLCVLLLCCRILFTGSVEYAFSSPNDYSYLRLRGLWCRL